MSEQIISALKLCEKNKHDILFKSCLYWSHMLIHSIHIRESQWQKEIQIKKNLLNEINIIKIRSNIKMFADDQYKNLEGIRLTIRHLFKRLTDIGYGENDLESCYNELVDIARVIYLLEQLSETPYFNDQLYNLHRGNISYIKKIHRQNLEMLKCMLENTMLNRS